MRHYNKKAFSGILLCIALLVVTWYFFMVGKMSAQNPGSAVASVVTPTNQPGRIILSWSGDCATTQSATWRTSAEIGESFAELTEAGNSPAFPRNKKTFAAKCESVESGEITYYSHSITFTDLKPDTMYHYRVGQGSHWSEWLSFTTGSPSEEPFSFLYFGDTQGGLDTVFPRLVRKAFLSTPEARFAVFTGDLVDIGSNECEWDAWFAALEFLASHYPIMPVPGNHDHSDYKARDGTLKNLWRPLFTLPENGPDSMKETCYTFVYNGVRMIGLDSENGAVVPWLEAVLKDNTCHWTIVYFHCPVYSPIKGRDYVGWRQAIKPIFDKYQVDLVLQGHDHVYSRTGQHTPKVDVVDLKNANELDPDSRTVYVTSVAGEKMYELDEKPFFVKTLTETQLFQVITIDGGTLTLIAKTATGQVIDTLVIEKTW